jgi:hypothetical protein
MAKTRLTPELQEKILNLIKQGNYVKTACLACGIHESTFYKWVQRGESAKSGKFFEFVESLNEAKAIADIYFVQNIRKAGENYKVPGNWKAMQYLLQARNPEDWVVPDKIEMETNGKMKIDAEVKVPDPLKDIDAEIEATIEKELSREHKSKEDILKELTDNADKL